MTYPDLARLAVSAELGHDGRSTEVGRHAEVREAGRGEDDDRELVEEPGAARALQCGRPRMSVLGLVSIYKMRTKKSRTIVPRRVNVMNANAAHSQSEPWVLMWSSALGGLRPRAWLAMAVVNGTSEY